MAEDSRWGEIGEGTLSLVESRQGAPQSSDWRRTGWAELEKIADPVVIKQLKQDVKGWPSAPDEPFSPAEEQALCSVLDRLVPSAYYMGRLLLGTADRFVQWDPDHAELLLEEFAHLRIEADPIALLPVLEVEFVDETLVAAGLATEDSPAADVAAMAFDDAVMFAFFEHDRVDLNSGRVEVLDNSDEDRAESLDTPPEELVRLAASESLDVRWSVASNRNTPSEVLEILGADPDNYIRRYVAENPSCSVGLLRKLATDSDPLVRRNVGSNPTTPAEIVETLSRDKRLDARIGSINPKLSAVSRERLLSDRSFEVRRTLAYTETDPGRMERLADDKDERVRYWVAINRLEVSPNPQARLARDESPLVRHGVAISRTAPLSLLRALSSDREALVRAGVAENTRTPEDLIAALASDRDPKVRAAAARNESLPIELLGRLALDAEPVVRQGVGHNPRTSSDMVDRLSMDTDPGVRSSVTGSPNLSPEAHQRLLEDPEELVRSWARTRSGHLEAEIPTAGRRSSNASRRRP